MLQTVVEMEAQKKKRRYSEEYIKYGFTVISKNGIEMPQCVICAKVLSPGAMKPSLLQRHLQGCHQELKGKDVDYFKRKEAMLNHSRLDQSGSIHQSTKAALHASYVVSLRIAQQKKPHSIGETLILPCTKDIVKIMLGEQYANKLNTLALSDNTVQRRISDMSIDIKDQVVSEMKTAPLGIFAIQLDETTDVANCAQLLAFTRYIKNDDFKEEFLFCQTLEASTTGADIFELVNSFFEAEGLQWNNLCGCTTDGAPAMLGSQSGFKTRIKAVNSQAKHLHCMIHRQALASKTLPTELKLVFDTTVKMVNFVKSSALNTRLFRLLCSDLDSVHEILLYHTEVRWLSRGNVVKRVFELQEELKEFFSRNVRQESQMYHAKLNDPKWVTHLAYLVDIFTRLNILNKSLQGADVAVTDFVDKLKSFIMKLELWQTKVRKGNFDMFDTLADMQDTFNADQVANVIVEHLSSLQNELKRYFPDMYEVDLKLIRNPFHTDIASVNDNIQEEFIDLVNDSSARDHFEKESLIKFWCKISKSYPRVAEVAVRSLLLFPSTYLCESGFSSLLFMKSKIRSGLNVEADLGCALAKTAPRLSRLVDQKQHQPSH